MKPTKKIEIVAGPNGSGKSTFAQAYFKLQNGKARFINADVIAAGLSAGNEQSAAFEAGRVMLTTVAEAIWEGKSFSFESTLSGKNWIRVLKEARKDGYEITIYFVYLEKAAMNLQRIRQRVKEGGHTIPRETVMRRLPRAFENFWKLYRPLCDNWFIFNNSAAKPKEIQSKSLFEKLSKDDQLDFERQFFKSGKVS